MLSTLKFKLIEASGLLFAVIAAAIVGGATTAVVMASIPDSTGTIHGCYNTNNGNLSVIDSDAGQTCTNKQSPLSWSASGSTGSGASATNYAYAIRDLNTGAITLDFTRSKGVTNFVPVSNGQNSEVACITFSSTPTVFSLQAVGSTGGATGGDGEIKNQTGWSDNTPWLGGADSSNDMLCDQNAPGSNAWLVPNGATGVSYMLTF